MKKRWCLLCPDLEEARRNRERIADKELNQEFWENLRRTLEATPYGAPLPSDIQIGNLPSVGKHKGRHPSEEEVMYET